LFWRQISHTLMDISAGPNRTMKWVVPDGTRDGSNRRPNPRRPCHLSSSLRAIRQL
jgi:hypothetical protein